MADDETRKNLPADLRQIIATVGNDITIPHFSTVLQPQDQTLIDRGGADGLKIYDSVERDTHAYAVLQKRKLGLVARRWVVEPASNTPIDIKAAELIEERLKQINFDQLCLDLLDATLKGYSVVELVWTRDGAAITLARFKAHEQRRFVFGRAGELRLLTREDMMAGVEMPGRKFIVHRFGEKGNNPYGLGLGSRLFWCVLFKREGVAFWLTFLEKFASPTPVGKYPEGTLPAQQMALLNALRDMVQSGAAVVPIGSEIEYLEATRAGTASYKDWCEYWDTQMSLCVFGSTLATDIGGTGSRAASETHRDIEEQIIDADADLLSDTLKDTLSLWLCEFNLPAARPPSIRRPRAKDEGLHEDLRAKKAKNAKDELALLSDALADVAPESMADAAEAMAEAGLLPKIDRDVMAKIAPFLAGRAERMASLRASTALAAKAPRAGRPQPSFASPQAPGAHDHGMSAIADQLAGFADQEIVGMVDAFRAEVVAAEAAGEDLAALKLRLDRAAASLDTRQFANILAAGISVAELTGRSDVVTENAADAGA